MCSCLMSASSTPTASSTTVTTSLLSRSCLENAGGATVLVIFDRPRQPVHKDRPGYSQCLQANPGRGTSGPVSSSRRLHSGGQKGKCFLLLALMVVCVPPVRRALDPAGEGHLYCQRSSFGRSRPGVSGPHDSWAVHPSGRRNSQMFCGIYLTILRAEFRAQLLVMCRSRSLKLLPGFSLLSPPTPWISSLH